MGMRIVSHVSSAISLGEASINFQIGTDDGPVGPRLALHRPC